MVRAVDLTSAATSSSIAGRASGVDGRSEVPKKTVAADDGVGAELTDVLARAPEPARGE